MGSMGPGSSGSVGPATPSSERPSDMVSDSVVEKEVLMLEEDFERESLGPRSMSDVSKVIFTEVGCVIFAFLRRGLVPISGSRFGCFA